MNKITQVEDAIALIQDNDVIAVCGYGTNGVPEKLLMGLEARFLETQKPSKLTLI